MNKNLKETNDSILLFLIETVAFHYILVQAEHG
jgi:hypothetical protein